MKKKNSMDLTQGPILKQLILFCIPIYLSLLLQNLYNAADRLVVGRFAGKLALAAVGSTGAATNILVNLVVGFATGANVVIANLRGAKKETSVREAMHSSLLLALLLGMAASAAGIFLARPMLEYLDTPADIIEKSTLYMRIMFCGTPVSMVYNFAAAIFRAHGDTGRPMVILGISGLANVLLNLVLVIVFRMEVAGVAIATITSQAISAVWAVRILMNPNDNYRLRVKELKFYREVTASIVKTGFPCSVTNVLVPFSGLFLQSSMNSFGATVIAGSSASDSITNLIAPLTTSIYTGCVSFSGQCYGAKKYDRLSKLLARAMALSFSCMTFLALICTIFPRQLLSIFTTDADAITAGIPKLLMVCWGYTALSISHCFTGQLRGMRFSTGPTVIASLCLCGSRLLWIWFAFPLNPTPACLYFCFPLSFGCNALFQGLNYVRCRRKVARREQLELI